MSRHKASGSTPLSRRRSTGRFLRISASGNARQSPGSSSPHEAGFMGSPVTFLGAAASATGSAAPLPRRCCICHWQRSASSSSRGGAAVRRRGGCSTSQSHTTPCHSEGISCPKNLPHPFPKRFFGPRPQNDNRWPPSPAPENVHSFFT